MAAVGDIDEDDDTRQLMAVLEHACAKRYDGLVEGVAPHPMTAGPG